MNARRHAVVCALALVAIAAGHRDADAQEEKHLWVAASGAAVTSRSAHPAGTREGRGVILGGEGRFSWGPVSLRLAYREGSLESEAPDTAADRDLAEGLIFLGTTVLPGFEVAGGLHTTAYITSTETLRWVLWELRARYEGPLYGPVVHGYVEGWFAVSGRIRAEEVLAGARGGEAGFVLRPWNGPVALRVSYGIDAVKLSSDGRRETADGVGIALGFGRR